MYHPLKSPSTSSPSQEGTSVLYFRSARVKWSLNKSSPSQGGHQPNLVTHHLSVHVQCLMKRWSFYKSSPSQEGHHLTCIISRRLKCGLRAPACCTVLIPHCPFFTTLRCLPVPIAQHYVGPSSMHHFPLYSCVQRTDPTARDVSMYSEEGDVVFFCHFRDWPVNRCLFCQPLCVGPL